MLSVFFSEGGSADYIVTGALSAKAAKEVNLKKKIFAEVLLWPSSIVPLLYTYIGELSDVHLGRALSCIVLSKLDV